MVNSTKQVIIFGSGICGCTLARVLAEKGHQVKLLETKNHIGGNCYDYKDKNGILVHLHGPHIFHTSNEEVYKFIKRFCKLNSFENQVLAYSNGQYIPLPINFQSIKLIDPKNSDQLIKKLKQIFKNKKVITYFELASVKDKQIKKMSNYIFENFYANYSSKMWGVPFKEISPSTINRVKICLSNNRSYFPEDKYQGLPTNGYTDMLTRMVKHKNIKLCLNSKYKLSIKHNKTFIDNKLTKATILYCGPIDELSKFKFGMLPYRSLDIKFESLNKDSYQPTANVNYPADKTMTRIAEYKKMSLQNIKNKTTISKEFPGKFSLKSKRWNVRYYPIKNKKNLALYSKYLNLYKNVKNLYFIGRLSEYKYYDMDDAIEASLELSKIIK